MKHSAGVLMYRRARGVLEVLLAHPGGPFWRTRDDGAWTIPKGGIAPGESAEDAARREFAEELGSPLSGALVPLAQVRQKGGKLVDAFALEGEFDPATLTSNLCEIEWPPRSGRRLEVPEIDRAAWFPLEQARRKILEAQVPLLDALARLLAGA